MNICLKSKSKENAVQTVKLLLQERLPDRIHSPCELTCRFQVVAYDNYYVVTLEVLGRLTIICQRCLKAFDQNYHNKTQLAVCLNESLAESLMEEYECIVVDEHELNLIEIVTDELYLFAPEKHENPVDCDREMNQWITFKNEIF
jgi:uncharacterized protein